MSDPERSEAVIAAAEENYKLKAFQSGLDILAHLLIGITVGIVILYVCRVAPPYTPNSQHILLCTIGYQLLMAEAIFCLSADNGWSARLKPVHKRYLHAVLQILGSGIALAGCFIRIINKNINFDSIHGITGLVAMVFTVATFFNGITSQNAMALRRFIPPSLSKLTHYCFGVLALVFASVSLCYGFDKMMFKFWAGEGMTYTLIAFTAIFTFIVMINPSVKFYKVAAGLFRN